MSVRPFHHHYRHNYHPGHHLHNSPSRIASTRPLVATGLTRATLTTFSSRVIAFTSIIWIAACGLTCGSNAATAAAAAAAAATTTTAPQPEQHREETERQMYPSLFVDEKVWRGNMEFGERSNWLAGKKPCSLLERVTIETNEVVVSVGDAMDSIAANGRQLKSDIREFVLPPDGVLLLEDDTLAVGPRDPAYLQMLNDTGDCFDSSTLSDEDAQRATWFKFQPHPDSQSWFNPSNWYSLMNVAVDRDGQLALSMVPESHQIPCAEDIVIFGNRGELSLFEPETERSRLLAFKVNFRAANSSTTTTKRPPLRTHSLRVSKLKIGDKSYTQQEFDQLATMYGNNMFQFRDELAAIGDGGDDNDSRAQRIITIDDSSIQANQAPDEFAVCHEEPGCECGNEQPAMMDIICSFNEPLELHEMPCWDPIQSAGFCNKICATSVNINMDPTRFSERYIANLVNKIMNSDEVEAGADRPRGYFSDYIFIGSRRLDHNKYEITMRPMASDESDYATALGRDLELAQLIRENLEKAATKSFYGIKTISIRSSVNWRQNNRDSIWTLTFIVLLPLAMTLFAKFDDHLDRFIAPIWLANHRSTHTDRRHLSMVGNETLIPLDNDNDSMRGIESTSATVDVAVDTLAMVDLDAHSTMGSTLNLLDVSGE